jgi:hypothetical protein
MLIFIVPRLEAGARMSSSNPLGENIEQYKTHSSLTSHDGPQITPRGNLVLDAIIVPATRPAAHLDHAVTLARAADCWLLILCSKELHSSEANEFLAARSYHKAIVIDLPSGYSHPLFDFRGLKSIHHELPEACHNYSTDLSMKRNIGLALARMLRWRRVFFLDDDIKDIAFPDLQTAVNMLQTYSTVGLWVTSFPDNSIVCHANRMTNGKQDVFVSGAALAVDCDADIGFFPDIYNEDWLFFFDNASEKKLANSYLTATQLVYSPFADPQRAAWQEFGDVLAEGLYGLLHLDAGIQDATPDYWRSFLEARWAFVEKIISRSDNAPANMRDRMLAAVEHAKKSSLTIKPEICAEYIQRWRQDLDEWKQRVQTIAPQPSVEEALQELGLESQASIPEQILPHGSLAAPDIQPGPAAIPQSETMKLADRTAVPDRTLTSSGEVPTDTVPFPVVTRGFSLNEMAATNRYGSGSGGADSRQRKTRLGRSMPRLDPRRWWGRGLPRAARPGELELPETKDLAAGPASSW